MKTNQQQKYTKCSPKQGYFMPKQYQSSQDYLNGLIIHS